MERWLVRYRADGNEAHDVIAAESFGNAWAKARAYFGEDAYSVELWAEQQLKSWKGEG